MVPLKEGETVSYLIWHQELENLLIEQGLQGYTERALLKHFQNRVNPENLVGYLELLLKEDKVQKFKHKKDFYWRATINLPKKH